MRPAACTCSGPEGGRHGRSLASRIVCGVIARVLMPGDAFWNMSGPVSWAVSVGLGLAGALVGYVILTLGLGIGDTDIFDWGGLFGALIGTVIVVGLASYFLRRRQPRPCRPPARRRPRHPGAAGDQSAAPTQGPPAASPPPGQRPLPTGNPAQIDRRERHRRGRSGAQFADDLDEEVQVGGGGPPVADRRAEGGPAAVDGGAGEHPAVVEQGLGEAAVDRGRARTRPGRSAR